MTATATETAPRTATTTTGLRLASGLASGLRAVGVGGDGSMDAARALEMHASGSGDLDRWAGDERCGALLVALSV